MSFILDALKKLEHRRRQESVPDLMTVHSPAQEKSRGRSYWPYVIAGALLLNAAVIMVWVLSPDKEEGSLKERVESEQLLTANAADRESGHSVSGVTPSPSPEIHTDAKADVIQDRIKPPVTPPVDASEPAAGSAEPERIETAEPDDAGEKADVSDRQIITDDKLASLRLEPSEEELDALKNKIRDEHHPVDNNVPDELIQKVEPESPDTPELPELSELPASLRDELPELKINGHVFSNVPSSRIMNINGTIIREGDTVSRGLKVREITMTGAILEYQGIRFSMRAF